MMIMKRGNESRLVYTNSMSYSYCQNRILFHKMHYSTNRIRRRRVCDIPSLIYEIERSFYSNKYSASDSGSVYELRDNDLEVMKEKLLSGNYTFSPLKLVRKNSPASDSAPFIIDIEATLEDELVLHSLAVLLIIEIHQSPYFSNSCYSSYSYEMKGMVNFFRDIGNWNGLESILCMDSSESLVHFSRSRLLEKVKAIVHYNMDIYRLIESFCNLPILSETGIDFSKKTGIPPFKDLEDVLFNILLDDIDKDLDAALPKMKYVRYLHIYLFSFTDLYDMNNCIDPINEIFHQNHLIPPIMQVAFKGLSSIELEYFHTILSISDSGKCKVSEIG